MAAPEPAQLLPEPTNQAGSRPERPSTARRAPPKVRSNEVKVERPAESAAVRPEPEPEPGPGPGPYPFPYPYPYPYPYHYPYPYPCPYPYPYPSTPNPRRSLGSSASFLAR